MAQQQIHPEAQGLDINSLLDDEANGNLLPEQQDQINTWRSQGGFPAAKPKPIPIPPTGPGFAERLRKGVGEYVTDPTQTGPDIGQMVGGMAGSTVGFPGTGAMLGRMGGKYAGEAIHQGKFIPDVPASSYLGEGGAALAGEVPGKAVSMVTGLTRAPMSEVGAKTREVLGEKSIIPDLTESTGWNFLRNVAREGMFGRGRMLQREEESGKTLMGKMTKEAEKELPVPPDQGGMVNPSKYLAGREAQDQLREQYITETAKGKAEYVPFMKQWGNVEIIPGDPETGTPAQTFKTLHALRSQALDSARDAAKAKDSMAQQREMALVHKISDKLESVMGPDIMNEYNAIGERYGKTMEKFNNPVVEKLREGVPAEQLMDSILHPEKLGIFAPFREMSTVPGRSMPSHQAVSQEDAVHLIRAALGEEKFRQFRADAIFQLGKENAIKTPGGEEVINGSKAVDSLKALPENVQNALFGPNRTANVNKIAEVAQHIQRARTGAGTLWIVMRQPSAIMGLGAAIGGGAMWAGASGEHASELGMLTSGTIVMAPWVLSHILSSDLATKVFVQTLQAPTNQMKAEMMKHLTTVVARTAATSTSHELKATIAPPQSKEPTMTSPGVIPLPPPR